MMNTTPRGKPDAGNPHVRLDEGEAAPTKPRREPLLHADLEQIISLLTEIRDLMLRHNETAEEKAQKRREKDRIRKAKKRALSAMSARTKETKSEKRDIPPTPPIERKGKSKEKEEEVVVISRTREERIRMVAAYNAELKGNIDPAYFVDYYAGKGTWPADWRAAFRVWLGNDRSDGRTTPKRDARAKYRGPRPDGYHDASEDEKKAILEGFV